VGKSGKLKGSKIHLLVDKNGLPVNVSVTAAGRDDRYAGFTLLYTVPQNAQIVCDKGYDASWFRQEARKLKLKPVIPRRQMGKMKRRKVSPVTYRGRWRNERGFAWLDHFKRLWVRMERYVGRYRAFVQLGCTVLCLRNLPD
jgi:transposase